MKTTIISFFSVLALISCSPKSSNEAEGTDGISKKNMPDGFTLESDSIVIPPFEFEVNLSERASKKLANDKETIIIRAYLSGVPKDSVSSPLIDEMGEVNLGSPEIELRKAGVARFMNVRISRKGYALLGDKDFQVLINVFSGRRSTELNLLECDIFREPLTVARSKKHVLKGKLIGE
jgi:hypothetical protein